ncbi:MULTISPECIES: cytochrome c oxidase subunit IVB [Bacillus]|uniref:cytochrome c oxidase subunit IVB n=1 Tax=Bacillus TaxID=1386 RepID=UPI0002DAC3AC|nr:MULTISPECIES: cytochrome c oxidase subunit IVB [Bacillus]
MGHNHDQLTTPQVDIKYRRKKNAEDMKYQIISFALMIFLTLVAFIAVGYDGFSEWYTIPVILLLAVVQVIFQLYYFMHMSHKGHGVPALFLYSGLTVGIVTVIAFVTIVWI